MNGEESIYEKKQINKQTNKKQTNKQTKNNSAVPKQWYRFFGPFRRSRAPRFPRGSATHVRDPKRVCFHMLQASLRISLATTNIVFADETVTALDTKTLLKQVPGANVSKCPAHCLKIRVSF